MQRSKTHFEQIPVKLVKQVAEEIYAQPETLEDFDLADAPHFTDGRPSQHSRRLPAQPHFLPGCALCGREVLLETSKFDEAGKAIHEECAVLSFLAKTKPATFAKPAAFVQKHRARP